MDRVRGGDSAVCEMEYMIKYAKTNSCKTIVYLIKYTNIIEKKKIFTTDYTKEVWLR